VTSVGDLTRAVFGRELSLSQAIEELDYERQGSALGDEAEMLWVGSIGYECFPDSQDFARAIKRAGVEQLIDVRELPISRRRGYAKTALSSALAAEGVSYIHIRELGNPKPIRDLYKSGDAQRGRRLYSEYLLGEQREALASLVQTISYKRSALMCLEHDQGVCHRDVILEALQTEMGLELEVTPLA
jgi:hypothetical protein